MLDACDTLDAQSLVRDMETSFGSVFGTLEHMFGADWIWLERWNGYHRGQVMQSVRQLGGRVKTTDYLYWLPEAR